MPHLASSTPKSGDCFVFRGPTTLAVLLPLERFRALSSLSPPRKPRSRERRLQEASVPTSKVGRESSCVAG